MKKNKTNTRKFKMGFFLAIFSLFFINVKSQINLEGKYIIQHASNGKLNKNSGTAEIIALGNNRYELKECFNGFPCEKSKFINVDGNSIKVEGETESSVWHYEFKENGNVIYYFIININFISYAQLAIKEGATTKMKTLNQSLVNETKATRNCPCCGKEYKKLKGFYHYKEGRNWNICTEKQDLLQKGKGKYACTEECAQNLSLGQCKK